ncbi:hypothetical protein KFK09_026281 [Dendrobium nobile]|uniref:Uncharacterized protein n=1 Tax=Dendrobium nobile TaxID=94219 RepID=A0A8T3A657_DENNO|nr:hypothetical protein KFK09_026281 [Dendrobium nobile]
MWNQVLKTPVGRSMRTGMSLKQARNQCEGIEIDILVARPAAKQIISELDRLATRFSWPNPHHYAL